MPALSIGQQFGEARCSLMSGQQSTTINAVIPVIASGTSTFFATSQVGTGQSAVSVQYVRPGLSGTTDVSVTLPTPAVQTAPVNAATMVTTATPFTWTAAPDTVNQLIVSTSGTVRASYWIYTTDSTATLPVIPELPVPANQAFGWGINGFGPHATIDAAATATGQLPVNASETTGPARYFTNGPDRTFTSAP